MPSKLVLSTLAGAVALASVPFFYERNPELLEGFLRAEEPAATRTVAAAEIRTVPEKPETRALQGKRVKIDRDIAGHFNAEFRLNGRAVRGMVDTGATLVAINASTARRIGIKLAPTDFRYVVKTANGETRAAGAVIDKLQIGRILVENVEAVVLDDEALDQTLIGASFLNRLGKYQVEDGALLLVQ
jgi:aspartyl protease family protein